MIQINGLSKTYTSKKGVSVKALDNINLTLSNTGMVFLLGKSGSGKSTLLNLLGGLDAPTSGSFVVGNTDSSKFKQNDYDAYRNTYLGFIFQEYNILEEFSVGVNIGLALELQGIKATSEAINKILKEVDLEGYGNRKPNELSGGQKQRVAIARALIKDPRIIMADEPTGALDSNTGKAVFQTLKNLSREKLVIVVSHDRENAELYADRIIELADGKIISDDTRTSKEVVESPEQGIEKFVPGYVLTAQDITLIHDYIEGKKTAVSVSTGKGTFKKTKPEDVKVVADSMDGKMIPSRLPIAKAFKMGVAPLKAKPVRLIFTVLLCVVAFTLFGVVDTLASFNYADAAYSSIEIGGYTSGMLQEYEYYDYGVGGRYQAKYMTQSAMESAKDELGDDIACTELVSFGTNEWDDTGYQLSSFNAYSGDLDGSFWSNEVYNTASLTNDELAKFGYELVGTLPDEKNEIALSKYFYTIASLSGFTNYEVTTGNSWNYEVDGVKYETVDYASGDIKSVSDFLAIEPKLVIDDELIDLTGIYDTGDQDDERFDVLRTDDYEYEEWAVAYNIWQEEKTYSLTMTMLVSGEKFEEVVIDKANSVEIYADINYNEVYTGLRGSNKVTYDASDEKVLFYDGAKLEDNQILVSANTFEWSFENINSDIDMFTGEMDSSGNPLEASTSMSYQAFSVKMSDLSWYGSISDTADYANYFASVELTDERIEELYYSLSVTDDSGDFEADILDSYVYLASQQGITFEESTLTKAQMQYYLCYRYQFSSFTTLDITYDIVDYYESEFYDDVTDALEKVETALYISNIDPIEDVEIVGLYMDYDTIVVNENFLADEEMGIYKGVYFNFPDDESELKSILQLGNDEGQDIIYRVTTPSSDSIENIMYTMYMIQDITFYVSLGFAVFAVLMMYNFMSVSIAHKRNEIGILRAIGSRGSDVFKIFFAEAFVIGLINCALAVTGTFVTAIFLNGMFIDRLGMVINILNVSIRQIGLLFGASMVAAFIASFLPVRKIAKKRPIDAIRGK